MSLVQTEDDDHNPLLLDWAAHPRPGTTPDFLPAHLAHSPVLQIQSCQGMLVSLCQKQPEVTGLGSVRITKKPNPKTIFKNITQNLTMQQHKTGTGARPLHVNQLVIHDHEEVTAGHLSSLPAALAVPHKTAEPLLPFLSC